MESVVKKVVELAGEGGVLGVVVLWFLVEDVLLVVTVVLVVLLGRLVGRGFLREVVRLVVESVLEALVSAVVVGGVVFTIVLLLVTGSVVKALEENEGVEEVFGREVGSVFLRGVVDCLVDGLAAVVVLLGFGRGFLRGVVRLVVERRVVLGGVVDDCKVGHGVVEVLVIFVSSAPHMPL